MLSLVSVIIYIFNNLLFIKMLICIHHCIVLFNQNKFLLCIRKSVHVWWRTYIWFMLKWSKHAQKKSTRKNSFFKFNKGQLGKPQKKVRPLMARPLRPPPPPSCNEKSLIPNNSFKFCKFFKRITDWNILFLPFVYLFI